MIGIYKISWDNNKYYYFGQAVNFKRRKACHISALKKNKHANRRIQRVYDKYGIPNIDLIEPCELSKLDEIETIYLTTHFGKYHCCNLAPDARSQKGLKHSNKSKLKMSQKHTGKKLSDAHKMNIKSALLKVNFNRKKLSEQFTGSKNPKAKKVIDTKTGHIYNTLVEAVKAHGLCYKQASEYLRGRSKNKTSLQYL